MNIHQWREGTVGGDVVWLGLFRRASKRWKHREVQGVGEDKIQIDNLIWVWNGQHADWYPGDAYVDIVAEDIYDQPHDYSPQESAYLDATQYAGMTKLVALSETGALLDPTVLEASRARWSWFMLWSGSFATTGEWNEDAMKQAVYASETMITLDELPLLY